MTNVLHAERIGLAYGTRTLLDGVSLGVARGEAVGVVGRNGDGKTTLLEILTGRLTPDAGQVRRSGAVSVGYLRQADDLAPTRTVAEVLLGSHQAGPPDFQGSRPDHLWAAAPQTRAVVHHLLGGVPLDQRVGALSGGERRRTALAALLIADHDLLVLDEPTNHLDVEAVDWLAAHLTARRSGGTALLVVSHDRWFLDAVCSRIWEVHDGTVDGYDGGYAAYVLARAEREQQAAGSAARRRNLLRKELAWLRRGAPARTSKPRFRVAAATALIADEPPPRDSVSLRRLAVSRLGKDVFELAGVSYSVRAGDEQRDLLDGVDLSIGPGDRIGLIGVNGSGKTSLLRLLTGDLLPDRGTVRRGRTVAIGHLAQTLTELAGTTRVLEAAQEVRRHTRDAGGADVSVTALLEDFGFRGDRLVARLDDLSGGERRRLQLLRLLLAEPNVLLLDEPTNDLDIDTLTVVEDYLDGWPGTLVVVSHDRYFLERVCDVTYALLADGSCALLPRGVQEYLERRRAEQVPPELRDRGGSGDASPAAGTRQARKDLARLESQLGRLETETDRLHAAMVDAATDHVRLARLQRELDELSARRDDLETAWLEAAEQLPAS